MQAAAPALLLPLLAPVGPAAAARVSLGLSGGGHAGQSPGFGAGGPGQQEPLRPLTDFSAVLYRSSSPDGEIWCSYRFLLPGKYLDYGWKAVKDLQVGFGRGTWISMVREFDTLLERITTDTCPTFPHLHEAWLSENFLDIYAVASGLAWKWTQDWHEKGLFKGLRLDFERPTGTTDPPEFHLRVLKFPEPKTEPAPGGGRRVCCCAVVLDSPWSDRAFTDCSTHARQAQEGALCCRWKKGKTCKTGIWSTTHRLHVPSNLTTYGHGSKLPVEGRPKFGRKKNDAHKSPAATETFCDPAEP